MPPTEIRVPGCRQQPKPGRPPAGTRTSSRTHKESLGHCGWRTQCRPAIRGHGASFVDAFLEDLSFLSSRQYISWSRPAVRRVDLSRSRFRADGTDLPCQMYVLRPARLGRCSCRCPCRERAPSEPARTPCRRYFTLAGAFEHRVVDIGMLKVRVTAALRQESA